jgi:hypothetical protein
MQKLIPVEDAVLRDTFWNAAIDLKKENDALKDRIQRLKKAGEDLAVCGYFMGFEDELKAWRKAVKDSQ